MTALVRFFLGFSLVLTSLFLILLVLIQRGRGGGLAGAFGGAGGQSAFGTKAGDVFTKITVGVAAFWILLCILSLNVLGRQSSLFSPTLGGAAPQGTAPITPPGGPAAPDDMTPATPETKPATPETKPATPEASTDTKPAAPPAAAEPAATEAPAAPAAGNAAEAQPAVPAEAAK